MFRYAKAEWRLWLARRGCNSRAKPKLRGNIEVTALKEDLCAQTWTNQVGNNFHRM